MHSNFVRLPVERARHKKRLPSQGWEPAARALVIDGVTLTGPFTFTQTFPANTATTSATSILTSASQTSSSSSASSTSALTTPSSTSSTPVSTVAALTPATPSPPSASAIVSPATTGSAANSNESAGIAAVSTQHGLPTGAIVGITIACVILLLGALLFFIRQRALRNRRQARQIMATWQTARPMTGVPPVSAGMGMTQQVSPGVSFAQLQAANIPQPMPSTYNNPVPPPVVVPMSAGAGASASASATVIYEFIPTLPDELSIATGEIVRVVSEFDDGWALCANARGEQGMVPLECLDRGSSTAAVALAVENYRNSRRTSSLAVRN